MADPGNQRQICRHPLRTTAVWACPPRRQRRGRGFRRLRRRLPGLRDPGLDLVLVFEHLVPDHAAHGVRLVDLALGAVRGFEKLGLHSGELLRTSGFCLLQQLLKLFQAFVPLFLQLRQRVQRVLLPADLLQQVIQIAGDLGDKFIRRLVCGDLTSLTGGLNGRIFVAVHDALQNRRVEAACLLRERGIRQSPDIQGIEALENIPA